MPRSIAAEAKKIEVHMSEEEVKVTESSGNVFADLGLPHPEEALAKAELAITIKRELDERKWTQDSAAGHLCLTHEQVSQIYSGRLGDFSRETLQKILRELRNGMGTPKH